MWFQLYGMSSRGQFILYLIYPVDHQVKADDFAALFLFIGFVELNAILITDVIWSELGL